MVQHLQRPCQRAVSKHIGGQPVECLGYSASSEHDFPCAESECAGNGALRAETMPSSWRRRFWRRGA